MKERKYFHKNLVIAFALLLAFTFSFVPTGFAQTKTIHYVAFGDSLAAGQTPYKQESGLPNYGIGYVDYIKELLEDEQYKVDLENFGHSGYTTSDVLNEILNQPEQIESIKQADVITIDVGANDLIKGAFNKETLAVDLVKAQAILKTIGKNYVAMLTQIKSLNPDADIYVMGFYHAFPHLENLDKKTYTLIDLAIHQLNFNIESATKPLGVTFIPTYDAMAQNFETYLPNPQDIHPSEEGYEELANTMWEVMKFDAPFHWKKMNENNVELTKNIELGKTWKVTFSTAVQEESLTDDSIYIVDSEFKRVDVSLDLSEDGRLLEVALPNNQLYNEGETYHLYITNALKSVDGEELQKEVYMKFTTATQ